METMVAIKRVKLSDQHLRPGRCKHTLHDSKGIRPFPTFTSLAITHYPGQPGYWLMYSCDQELGTDTFHESLEDALDQAKWEFDVRPEEWIDVNEPF